MNVDCRDNQVGGQGRDAPLLVISEREIRRHGPGNLLGVCWRQWRAERALRQKGIHFRSTDVAALRSAYAAMSEVEFDAINGRQDWANWRTIPRALSNHMPDQPSLGARPRLRRRRIDKSIGVLLPRRLEHYWLRTGCPPRRNCPPAHKRITEAARRHR